MSLISAAELAEFRSMARAEMRSRCAVLRRTGRKVTIDRMQVDEWAAVHTDLPFALKGGSGGDGGSRGITIGDVAYELATGVGKMPASTTDLEDEDVIVVTAGEWTGAAYSIVKAVKVDRATARRVPIVETEIPIGWTP